jgi:hypothetical protein
MPKPKLIFKFDKQKDLWNAWYAANHKAPWQAKVSKEVLSVLSLCKGKRLWKSFTKTFTSLH